MTRLEFCDVHDETDDCWLKPYRESPVLRHLCMADADRLFPPGTVFEDCPICSMFVDENERLREQVREKNIPVRYYRNGGRITAVYGTSSIWYVKRLREALREIEQCALLGGWDLIRDHARRALGEERR